MKKQTIQVLPRGESSLRSVSIDDFQEMMQMQYLPHLSFQSYRIYFSVYRLCQKAEMKGRIEKEKKWLGTYFDKQLKTGTVADVSIRWIDDTIGYGVFAERSFIPKEFIGEYTGLVKPSKKILPGNGYSFSYPSFNPFWKKHSIDAQNLGNEMRFVNHCDQPNAEAISIMHDGILRVIIRSIKPIAKGEQIHYDYGDEYWKTKKSRSRHRPFPEAADEIS